MLDLAERVTSGRDVREIPNGAYQSGGRTTLNDLRPLIADLDTLPLLDFAFEEEYVLDPTGSLVPNTNMRDEPIVLFSGSRGCNNSCTYCSNSQLKNLYRGKGPYARKMSVARFVEAAREYRRMFPRLEHFYFTDEDFFARPVEEMRELAETYPADVGLESGSERVRREIFQRHIDDRTQLAAAAALRNHSRARVLYFLILGNPYEEQQDLLEVVRLMEQLPGPFSLRAYNLVFIPGTKLFEKACRDGIIRGVDESAFELNFIGFDHWNHEWKRKNLYLNSLLYLMHGDSGPWWMGRVPRRFIPFLTSPGTVSFCDRFQVGEAIMSIVNLNRGVRNTARGLARRVVNPAVRYGNWGGEAFHPAEILSSNPGRPTGRTGLFPHLFIDDDSIPA